MSRILFPNPVLSIATKPPGSCLHGCREAPRLRDASLGPSNLAANRRPCYIVEMTQLSEQQRQALQEHPGGPVEVIDSVTRSMYVLLPRVDYERVRTLFEEDELHPDELTPLVNEMGANEGWNDPAMDVYDALDPRRQP